MKAKASIFGIVGRDGGYTKIHADDLHRHPSCASTITRRPTPRGCARFSGTSSSRIPPLSRTSAKWESMQ